MPSNNFLYNVRQQYLHGAYNFQPLEILKDQLPDIGFLLNDPMISSGTLFLNASQYSILKNSKYECGFAFVFKVQSPSPTTPTKDEILAFPYLEYGVEDISYEKEVMYVQLPVTTILPLLIYNAYRNNPIPDVFEFDKLLMGLGTYLKPKAFKAIQIVEKENFNKLNPELAGVNNIFIVPEDELKEPISYKYLQQFNPHATQNEGQTMEQPTKPRGIVDDFLDQIRHITTVIKEEFKVTASVATYASIIVNQSGSSRVNLNQIGNRIQPEQIVELAKILELNHKPLHLTLEWLEDVTFLTKNLDIETSKFIENLRTHRQRDNQSRDRERDRNRRDRDDRRSYNSCDRRDERD